MYCNEYCLTYIPLPDSFNCKVETEVLLGVCRGICKFMTYQNVIFYDDENNHVSGYKSSSSIGSMSQTVYITSSNASDRNYRYKRIIYNLYKLIHKDGNNHSKKLLVGLPRFESLEELIMITDLMGYRE